MSPITATAEARLAKLGIHLPDRFTSRVGSHLGSKDLRLSLFRFSSIGLLA
jgi:hypothetical protein